MRLANGSPVRGVSEGFAVAFRGIPFAEPPVGDLRWRPPVPSTAWTAIRDAAAYGNACAQPNQLMFDRGLPGPVLTGNEDCLFVNVYSPRDAITSESNDEPIAKALPVAVHIHGGAYLFRNGNVNASALVQHWAQVSGTPGVVVTFNYRLGVFGFLGADVLRTRDAGGTISPGGSTGNMGIQDQRLAMDWVRRNVADFGGDPARVTILGESAGAGSITNHLVMQHSWGLFNAAILQSCAFPTWATQPMHLAEQTFDLLVELAECSAAEPLARVQCLVDASPGSILNASFLLMQGGDPTARPSYSRAGPLKMLYFSPVADGVEVTSLPWLILADGGQDVANVPILHGRNRDETAVFLNALRSVYPRNFSDAAVQSLWSEHNFPSALLPNYLLAEYPAHPTASVGWWTVLRATTDKDFACAAQFTSSRLARSPFHTAKTFQYMFNHPISSVDNSARFQRTLKDLVYHGEEGLFVFRLLVPSFTSPHYHVEVAKKADVATMNAMSTVWGHFVTNHDPHAALLGSPWPAYDDTTEAAFLLGTNVVAHKYTSSVCDGWIQYLQTRLQDCVSGNCDGTSPGTVKAGT